MLNLKQSACVELIYGIHWQSQRANHHTIRPIRKAVLEEPKMVCDRMSEHNFAKSCVSSLNEKALKVGCPWGIMRSRVLVGEAK
jgi:hypothetical protein